MRRAPLVCYHLKHRPNSIPREAVLHQEFMLNLRTVKGPPPMEQPTSRYDLAERLIRKLRGVSNCHIQPAPDGTIESIYVTARGGRNPKQMARDVESILAAEAGMRVDHRKISIAIVGEAAAVAEETLVRVSVAGVGITQTGVVYVAEVTLAAGDLFATGRSSGTSTRGDSRRVVAAATLEAITKLSTVDPGFSLGELQEKSLGNHRIMIVAVHRLDGREERTLLGCCEVGHDVPRAVIYAVLDAVNRVLGTLPPREPVEYEIGPAPVA